MGRTIGRLAAQVNLKRPLRPALRQFRRRTATLTAAVFCYPLDECLGFHVFHHEMIDSILTTDVVESADVRMIQAGDNFGFALETFAQFSATGKMRRQNCDGDNSVEAGVSGAVNLTHPTSA